MQVDIRLDQLPWVLRSTCGGSRVSALQSQSELIDVPGVWEGNDKARLDCS